MTSWYGRTSAPWSRADRTQPHTVFHESIAASGTKNARDILGFSLGSLRRASATGISSAGMSDASQASTNRSA
jgi:hypothetical protein